MNDGARTHDNRNHNPGLYQLSYAHHKRLYNCLTRGNLVRLAGLEPATPSLEGWCSIQLSYKRKIGRGRGIRTPDILLPKQARYQTALYPDDRASEARRRSERMRIVGRRRKRVKRRRSMLPMPHAAGN